MYFCALCAYYGRVDCWFALRLVCLFDAVCCTWCCCLRVMVVLIVLLFTLLLVWFRALRCSYLVSVLAGIMGGVDLLVWLVMLGVVFVFCMFVAWVCLLVIDLMLVLGWCLFVVWADCWVWG